jgi:Mn2+/Fe2+ NRAMP family transporter
MSSFWQTWLRGWCWAVGLFGVALAGSGWEATSGPTRLLMDVMNGPDAFNFDPTLRFTLCVLGGVTIGWAISLWAGIKAAMLLGPQGRQIWALIVGGVLAWFGVDSTLSVVTGFGLNAVANTGFLVTFLLPVWRSGVLKAGTT